MRLNSHGREVYRQSVTLDPVATGTWEASFDDGATWVAGTDLGDGSFGWLVAGFDNDGADNPVYQFPAGLLTITPLLRLVTGQEEIVVDGTSIDID